MEDERCKNYDGNNKSGLFVRVWASIHSEFQDTFSSERPPKMDLSADDPQRTPPSPLPPVSLPTPAPFNCDEEPFLSLDDTRDLLEQLLDLYTVRVAKQKDSIAAFCRALTPKRFSTLSEEKPILKKEEF